MISRIWHGWTTTENADAYEALLKAEVLPGIARASAGFLGVDVLRRDARDETEFVTVTRWESMAAVRALVGEDVEAAYVPADARQVLARFDERAVHYDTVLEWRP
jgi:heme-degrading monooxygenase HmoA